MNFRFNTRMRLGAIILKNRHILAVRPRDYEKYILPGGEIKLLESSDECLQREIREEINCTFKSARFFGAYYTRENKLNRVTAAFLVRVTGRPRPCSEISELKWLAYGDIDKFGPHTQRIILDLAKEKLV